jgi:hypothetical protein
MTIKTLEEVVAGIQTIALTVTGISQAPASVPSNISGLPTVVTYPASGSFGGNSAGWGTELHVIAIDLLVSGADVAQVYKLGLSLLGPLFRALEKDVTLGGNVQTYDNLTYSFDKAAIVWTIKINGVKLLPTW